MNDLLRIMTAGSVDDGKSTLIGRLLYDADALYDDCIDALQKGDHCENGTLDFSLVTDGLRAEREQKITIDVAYRYFATPRRRFIIADAPGHEQYTRNMATAASNADLAVLLIDARLGVQTQSKRHAFICSLLGVPRLLVAVNKMDLVGFSESRFLEIEEEYREFAIRLGLKNLCFIPVCAVDGDNLIHPGGRMPWYGGSCLLPYLEDVYFSGDRNLVDFRMPVQRVVRPTADFRGYSGNIASGVLRTGDEVIALPGGFRALVTGIFLGAVSHSQAIAGQAITITLDDDLDIGRGDLLVHPGNVPREYKELDLMVVWTGDEHLFPGTVVHLKHACKWVKARCELIHYRVDPNTLRQEQADHLALNDIARIKLTLHNSIFADTYSKNRAMGSLVIVSVASNDTLGAATILERTDYDNLLKIERSASEKREIVWHNGQVTASDRHTLFGHNPMTLWFTGLSGSGKSTLAFALEQRLISSGIFCYVLDGDNVRHGLNRDLGFSPLDRAENIRRVAEVARLMNSAGLIVLSAFISPFREDREMARTIIGTEEFVEVHISTTLAVCEARDTKGLYRKARTGELPGFTGISSPYETPIDADMTIDTATATVDECIELLVQAVTKRCKASWNYFPAGKSCNNCG